LDYVRSRATLVLEDGAAFEGWTFAGEGEVAGEVVFTTSMVGYQETITDPSYRGQILLFTYPLIGNYGVIPGDDEDAYVLARGAGLTVLCGHNLFKLAPVLGEALADAVSAGARRPWKRAGATPPRAR